MCGSTELHLLLKLLERFSVFGAKGVWCYNAPTICHHLLHDGIERGRKVVFCKCNAPVGALAFMWMGTSLCHETLWQVCLSPAFSPEMAIGAKMSVTTKKLPNLLGLSMSNNHMDASTSSYRENQFRCCTVQIPLSEMTMSSNFLQSRSQV